MWALHCSHHQQDSLQKRLVSYYCLSKKFVNWSFFFASKEINVGSLSVLLSLTSINRPLSSRFSITIVVFSKVSQFNINFFFVLFCSFIMFSSFLSSILLNLTYWYCNSYIYFCYLNQYYHYTKKHCCKLLETSL
ncbi:hypothetical protein D920_00068 [Enterococcus faecalis 13-SD-W-01]|nr:hypothetical protein D920_00068 [Enterococcus faecalis 13-SD-W-01]